jgi:hypothetical protein
MTKTRKPNTKKSARAVPPMKRTKGKASVPLAMVEPIETKEQAADLSASPEGKAKTNPKGGRKGRLPSERDPRLPKPGSVLRKEWRGREYEITVLDEGFEYAGKSYRSLSKIANEITGTTWNGFLWVGLTQRPEPKAKSVTGSIGSTEPASATNPEPSEVQS